MENLRINGNDLIALGYKENEALGVALKINKLRLGYNREEMLQKFHQVLTNPESFSADKVFGPLANMLLNVEVLEREYIPLKTEVGFFQIYGTDQIELSAKKQMNTAMKLPITVGGALMPDAHQGYGLPIGGVLATNNSVIPFGVGVDIGCRMALSIFDLPVSYLENNHDHLKKVLMKTTRFGAGNGFLKHERANHRVLENNLFNGNPFIQNLKDKAWNQLGSSGGGNHFVEFGIMVFESDDQELGLAEGKYLALLSHSGSRGMGAMIANHYTKLAMELCRLPYEAKHLAYFDLDSAEGEEYWLAMICLS